MYTPRVETIRSGERDFRAPALSVNLDQEFDQFQQASKDVQAAVDKKYKDSTDFYDLQRAETDNLNKLVDGLEGKDYESMMQSVVAARDEFTNIFRGKKLKDYNTPEFQKKLFDKKKELMSIRNGLTTSKNVATAAREFMKNAPHGKQLEMRKRLEEYINLPVQDRGGIDLVNEFSTDPQYFNAVDFITKELGSGKRSVSPYRRITNNILYSGQKEFLPTVYSMDENGKEVLTISNETIEQLAEKDPRFWAVMENMALESNKAKGAVDSGNTEAKHQATLEFARQYVGKVEELKARETKGIEKIITRPTASDKKAEEEKKAALDFFENLKINPEQALAPYVENKASSGSVSGFDVKRNGSLLTITPLRYSKDIFNNVRAGKKPASGEVSFTVDLSNPSTVQNFLGWVKDKGTPSGSQVTKPNGYSRERKWK